MWMKAKFHKKRWAPGLALKKRPKVIRKWPIIDPRRGKLVQFKDPSTSLSTALHESKPWKISRMSKTIQHFSSQNALQWLTWVIDSAAIRFVNVNSYKFFVLCKVILSKGRKKNKQKNYFSFKSDKICKPHFHPSFVKANYHNTVLCFRWAILKSSLVVWSILFFYFILLASPTHKKYINKDINDANRYNAGRDTATACANYCGPGTHKIEIKL